MSLSESVRRRVDDGVWAILGPILLTIVLAGGGGWLAYVQGQIGDLAKRFDEQKENGALVRERLRAVEVALDGIKNSLTEIKGDASSAADSTRKLLEIAREDRMANDGRSSAPGERR